MLEKLGISSSKGVFRSVAIGLFLAALNVPALAPYSDVLINIASFFGVTGIAKPLILNAGK